MSAFATIDTSNATQLLAVVDGLEAEERRWTVIVHNNGWNEYRCRVLAAIRAVLARIRAQMPAAVADPWTRHCRTLDAIKGGWA